MILLIDCTIVLFSVEHGEFFVHWCYYEEIRAHSIYSNRKVFNPAIRWLQIIGFLNHLAEWSGIRWPQVGYQVLKTIFIVEMT